MSTENFYNTTQFFYSQQSTPSWFIQGLVGAQLNSQIGVPGHYWRLSAGATLIKQFQHSSISIAYMRGRGTTTTYTTNNSEDRVDVNYRVEFNRRLSANVGLGYYREAGQDPRTQAKYATADVRYLLA